MSFGIIDVITLLLGMAGLGLTPNPHPPTVDQALRYAIADADIVAHVDAASLIPGNYKLLSQLADQPQVRSSPELKKLLREVTGEIEGARGVAKLATGIDVATDIADATAFVQLASLSKPNFVVTVHGKFAAANLEKIAVASGGSTSRVDAGTMVDAGAARPAIGLTKDGVMLIGTPALWWPAIPVLAWGLWRAVTRADWRYAAVLVGYGVGILPWLANIDRQMYFFYVTPMAPFLVLLIVLALGEILGRKAAGSERRGTGLLVVALYVGIVVANFVWLWPILNGNPITPEMWQQQLWLPSWR